MNLLEETRPGSDRCVYCGLCLPHCPTYRLSHSESESPRGRISLIQALARGQLSSDSAGLAEHLDHCLVCRACEQFCPSQVPYGSLIDAAREQLLTDGVRTTPPALRRLLDTVSSPDKTRRLGKLLRGYQTSGAQRLVRASGLLKGLRLDGLEAQLPQLPPPWQPRPYYPAIGEQRGEVGLFLGCIGSLLEAPIQQAAVQLLTHMGLAVHIPQPQGCCGSLHHHHGERRQATELARALADQFAGLQLDAIIGASAGCMAQLFDYPNLYGETANLNTPVRELCDFTAAQPWPDTLPLKPLAERVGVHLPCSQRNVLRRPDAVFTLLANIPELEAIALPGNEQCCGAAGSYMLTQPEQAARLRDAKLAEWQGVAVTRRVSNNVGCAQHLSQGLSSPLQHPLLLLMEQLAVELPALS